MEPILPHDPRPVGARTVWAAPVRVFVDTLHGQKYRETKSYLEDLEVMITLEGGSPVRRPTGPHLRTQVSKGGFVST